jgi:hypothetical protein
VGWAIALNSFIADLLKKGNEGLQNSVLPYLVEKFDSLSIYEQKFKFKPYKYSLDFYVLSVGDVVSLEIRATLSQGGKCITKSCIPAFWHTTFCCLCEKE